LCRPRICPATIREAVKVVTADERMVNAFAALDRTISLAIFS
jgi:hypothetical protein